MNKHLHDLFIPRSTHPVLALAAGSAGNGLAPARSHANVWLSSDDREEVQAPQQPPTETPLLQPVTEPAAAGAPASGSKWLVMLYQDAKDKVLDQDIFTDLNEAERTGSTAQVRVVAQIDRYRGPSTGA